MKLKRWNCRCVKCCTHNTAARMSEVGEMGKAVAFMSKAGRKWRS